MVNNPLEINQAYVDHYYQTYLRKRLGINSCKALDNLTTLSNNKFLSDQRTQDEIQMQNMYLSNCTARIPKDCNKSFTPVLPIHNPNAFKYIAGENLSVGKLVYIKDGKIYLYNGNDELLADMLFGITTTAAVIDTIIEVQIDGIYTKKGLNLISGESYFAGEMGTLSVVPLPICTVVGLAVSPDSIKIEIQQSIITL